MIEQPPRNQRLQVQFHPLHSSLLGEEAPIPTGGVRPTFTERPTIRQVEEGKITFECRLVGEPRPDVRDGAHSRGGPLKLDKEHHLGRGPFNSIADFHSFNLIYP